MNSLKEEQLSNDDISISHNQLYKNQKDQKGKIKPTQVGKTEKKYHRRKKNDINEKPYKCGCSKEFNDYSSLYTHIKTNHDLKIPENTVLPQLKKKDVMIFLKDQKGEPEYSEEYDIQIDWFVVFFLNQEELLNTILKFEDAIDKDNDQKNTISDFFHGEDQSFFKLEETQQNKELYPNIFKDQYAKLLISEYLKPFNTQTAQEFIIIFDFLMNSYEKSKSGFILYQEVSNSYQEQLKQNVFQNIKELNQQTFQEFLKDMTFYFKNSLESMPEFEQQYQIEMQQQQLQLQQNISVSQSPTKKKTFQMQQQPQQQKTFLQYQNYQQQQQQDDNVAHFSQQYQNQPYQQQQQQLLQQIMIDQNNFLPQQQNQSFLNSNINQQF